LLANLGVKRAASKRAGEVEIALERGRGIGQHTGEVWDYAEVGVHSVEKLFGFAVRLCGVELIDAIHVRFLVFDFSLLATIHGNCTPKS